MASRDGEIVLAACEGLPDGPVKRMAIRPFSKLGHQGAFGRVETGLCACSDFLTKSTNRPKGRRGRAPAALWNEAVKILFCFVIPSQWF
ncbi:hypothetical protein [Gluconacetobacter asukensis]|uniref:Uncharacterized protein n=1 Tax=Gluconacetobacter asukensis TaxID=1017181 RepID=A0A7W4P0Z4_9PROT|nr:hypothetical protein [Gluconacetobacter asukensis]MBB2173457.1 hypothetical protein [Gluconacetobacter asukensis]